MKMKKRILSLTLAVALIAAMSIPASAASVWRDHTYDNSSFSSLTSCYTDHWSCLIEFMYSSNSYADYVMRVDVRSYEDNGNGTGTTRQYTIGKDSTRIASNNVTVSYPIFGIYAYYFINGTQICDAIWANAA